MNVKKFTAGTTREAMRKVRDTLGQDAVILSNRTVDGGVEILALANDDISSLAQPAVEPKVVAKPAAEAPRAAGMPVPPVWPRVETARPAVQVPQYVAAPLPEAMPPEVQQYVAPVQPQYVAPQPQFVAPAAPARAEPPAARNSASELMQVMKEIRSMRGMVETQLAEISWDTLNKREPHRAEILREMIAAGFSASLSRYLTEKLPSSEKPGSALSWVKNILTRNISTLENENAVLERGGVFALVGPTGVGKTTTTAKLAARCVMRHGPGKLALITTDGYRIGGHEQLRIYGKILGVMVHSVKDEADLRIALRELKNKHTVLIDTVGMSQRDQMVTEQVAMLSDPGIEVKRLLCLNATSTGETLNEVVRAYQGKGLDGCIITKLDEAATIGSALDAIIRWKLNLFYVSNGQRVPEDLHLANRLYLVDRAFKLKRESAPFEFQDGELPMVVANAARGNNDKSLREVNLG